MIDRIVTLLTDGPLWRDLLLLGLALSLIASPAWAPAVLWISDGYEYESTEVIATDTGLEFADPSAVPDGVPISDEIACSGTLIDRTCALERTVVDGGPQPLGIVTENVEADDRIVDPPYRFVQLDRTIYRIGYDLGAEEEDGFPVLANASPAIPDAALHAVAVDEEDAPRTAVEAAEEGEAVADGPINVPNHPIAMDDGSHRRVYLVEEGPRGANSPLIYAVFFGLTLGITILFSLSRKVRISVRYIR